MPITGAFIFPHPPIILPQIGRGEESKIQRTSDACRNSAKRIAELRPDTIIVISPHSVMYGDYIHISPGEEASGSMSRFGAPEIKLSVRYDNDFVRELTSLSEIRGINAGILGEREQSLDHGTMLPLCFINEVCTDYKLVRVSISGLSFAEHYRLGQCISEAAEDSDKNIVIVASGDLSHRLMDSGPYDFAPEGPEFDRQLTDALGKGDFLPLLCFPAEFCEAAGECGLRSFIIMAGALDGREVDAKLLSYEGPFGVGYAVGEFIPKGHNYERCFLEAFDKINIEKISKIRANEDEYVRLARYSAEHFIKTGKRAAMPEWVSDELKSRKAGVFVSIKKHGNLRGCIGTISAVRENIAEEILRNAVSSCSEDPRFAPVKESELAELVYSVDVLDEAEPVDSADMLDVKRYGVIVSKGDRRGLLLPNLEGIDTVREQLSIALRKGGISEHEDYRIERFEVVRHN